MYDPVEHLIPKSWSLLTIITIIKNSSQRYSKELRLGLCEGHSISVEANLVNNFEWTLLSRHAEPALPQTVGKVENTPFIRMSWLEISVRN